MRGTQDGDIDRRQPTLGGGQARGDDLRWHVRRPARGSEPEHGHRMSRYALERLLKSRRGVGRSALPKTNRTDRVPRVCAALAGVEMTTAFGRQFALERRDRRVLVTPGK